MPIQQTSLTLPINSITPRTLELREKGMVEEGIHQTDPKTHRKTIYWRIRK